MYKKDYEESYSQIQYLHKDEYESSKCYDRNGRIVFTSSKGFHGVGFSRSECNEIKDMKSSSVSRKITEDTLSDWPVERLITIYRVQFQVMRQYESDTWYDQNGRIIFTSSKGLPGVGFSRSEWNNIKHIKTGSVNRIIIDDTLPGGPVEKTIEYIAPFDRCNKEQDFKESWSI